MGATRSGEVNFGGEGGGGGSGGCGVEQDGGVSADEVRQS
ncbi:hypothetical protein PL10110_490006 [Planktothrix agardhii]|nr:hypothetical protein PL10110_490006 [Planktothrix agardhii]